MPLGIAPVRYEHAVELVKKGRAGRKIGYSKSTLHTMNKHLFSKQEWAAIVAKLNIPDQQQRILWLLLNGYKDADIATELEISPVTVRSHFNRLFDRLHVRDRTDLVVCILRLYRQIQASKGIEDEPNSVE